MRLLNVHTLLFNDYHFRPNDIPKYTIASHRWNRVAESTLEDIQAKQNTHKAGYAKVLHFVRYVKERFSDLDWIWIDTCCIDHRNSQEVSTAINSMFRWYARAEICLVYLADIQTTRLEEFRLSEWWTRGWTLQELLAPRSVLFLTKDWHVVGHKGVPGYDEVSRHVHLGPSLDSFIASFTRIPEAVLRNYDSSQGLPPEQKLAWATGRKTNLEEDMSYCLFGLLDVTMIANYGEGGNKARRRLLRELSEATFEDFSAVYPNPAPSFRGRSQNDHRQDPQGYHRRLLDSLHFPQLKSRREQVGDTYHGTYRWALLTTSTSGAKWDNIITWLQDPSPTSRVYWIHAKPGAGKSSLMRFLEDNLEQDWHMLPWSRHSQVLVMSYYFWNPGNILQKSLAGLLRTILYELICKRPDILNSCLPPNKHVVGTNGGVVGVWTTLELRLYLGAVLSTILSSTKILFFVDGLDEIGGVDDDRDELVGCLKELAGYPCIKLCVSSRQWPVFQDAFGTCPQLRLEDLNAEDIALYVRTQLLAQDRFRQMMSHDATAEELIDNITDRAKGVFLWIRLVVRELLHAIRDGDTIATLQQKAHSIPGDLDAYFGKILDTIDEHHRSQACALLQIALHEESEWIQLSSLRLIDLIFIAHGASDFALSSNLARYAFNLRDVDVLIYTLNSALRMLSSRCKGLIECYFHQKSAFLAGYDEIGGIVVSTDLPPSVTKSLLENRNFVFDLRIDFMHRSLRDYLLEPRNQDFLHRYTGGPFDVRDYLRNARLCQLFMVREWQLNTTAAVGLASYVICALSSPGLCATERGARLVRRLEPAMGFVLGAREQIPPYWYVASTFEAWDDEGSDFTTLAIDFGWTGYLNSVLTAELIRGKRGRPILDHVLRPRFHSSDSDPSFQIANRFPDPLLVEKLLTLGADPNELYQDILVWPRFLLSISSNLWMISKSSQAVSAYTRSLSIMIEHGANTFLDGQQLFDGGFRGGVVARTFEDFNFRRRSRLGSQSSSWDPELISVVEVLESFRYYLGDAIDSLQSMVEERTSSNYLIDLSHTTPDRGA